MARDPKEGRAKIAADLNIPASWVWIVRTATQQTKVAQGDLVMHNRFVLKKERDQGPRSRVATKPKE